jgi:antitoxin component of MazEF toxin-antitoxin module
MEIVMPEIVTRTSKISQWGNGAAVRLGAASLETAHFSIDDAVEVIARQDEIVIRRQRPRVTMAELLANFDPDKHRHDLAFDAEPMGTETK